MKLLCLSILLWLFSMHGACYGAQIKDKNTTTFFLVSTLVFLVGIFFSLSRIKK